MIQRMRISSMKAEETLQVMADFYPTLFQTRQQALNHLFCTIGNGYHWENGELVDGNTRDNIEGKYKLITDIEKAYFRNEKMINNFEEFHKNFTKDLDEKTKEKLNTVIELTPLKWYPLSEYSYIFDYPDDIKPDWKLLLEECKELLKADGIDVEEVKRTKSIE